MSNDGPPPDHVVGDSTAGEDSRDASLEDNLKSKSTWLRLLFMMLFLVFWGVSRFVVLAVVVVQFFWVLFTGDTNKQLGTFGLSLATYSYQIVSYLTFNTEEQPFPFADWPLGPPKSSGTNETES
jgi:hypothetical protein